MLKSARNHAIDPAQEGLRQEKADWNQECSSLIGGLIGLKKGLNGRGDSKLGLPVSRIHQPFPHEIINHLSKTIDAWHHLVSGAEKIVADQNSYAEQRQQKLVQASWIGSRGWAYLFTRADNRKKILEMLSTSAKLYQDAKKLEDHFAEPLPRSIPKLVTDLERLTRIFIVLIVEKFHSIHSPNSNIPTTTTTNSSQDSSSSSETRSDNTTDITLEMVQKDLLAMEIVSNYLLSKTDDDSLKEARILQQSLELIERSFKEAEEIDASKVIAIYYKSLNAAKLFLKFPEAKSFNDLLTRTKTAILQISDSILRKNAGNALTRALNRAKLKFFSTAEEQLKITCIEALKHFIEELDHLMDVLENPKLSSIKINQAIMVTGFSLTDLISRVMDLGRIYNTEAQDQRIDLGPKAEAKRIPMVFINNLRALRQELIIKIKPKEVENE